MTSTPSDRVAATVLELADGRHLAYAELGDPAGRPVFAFHGTPGSRMQLSVMDEAARRHAVRLVLPDRPGYGYSDFVRGRRLADWADDVVAIADHLGLDRVGVLGVSGGGPHALACASCHPDRVAALSVVSGVGPLHDRQLRDQIPVSDRVLPVLRLALPVVRFVIALLLRIFRLAPRALSAAFARVVPEPDRRVMLEPAFVDLAAVQARHGSPTTARAATQDLSLFSRPWGVPIEDIRAPTDVWHGSEDATVPAEHGRVVADIVPGAEFHLVEGEAHLLVAVRADEILSVLAERLREAIPPARVEGA